MFRGKGFTLVELLVVLIIIGILVAIAVPSAFRAINQANIRECAANIRSLNTAVNMYYTEHSRTWPTAIGDLSTYVSGGTVPQCHVGTAAVAYTLTTNATTGETQVSTTGHTH